MHGLVAQRADRIPCRSLLLVDQLLVEALRDGSIKVPWAPDVAGTQQLAALVMNL